MTPEEIHELQDYVERCVTAPLLRTDDPLYEPLDEGEPVRGSGGRSKSGCSDFINGSATTATRAAPQLEAVYPRASVITQGFCRAK